MSKIIKIESCTECRYWDWDYCYHPDVEDEHEDAIRITCDTIPGWCPLQDAPDPHELWAAAQLMPGEGIEDGVMRIAELLRGE